MARTNLSIDRKIFDDFAAQVSRRNMTLFAFANESLSAITKIAAEGGDPSRLYSIWKVISVLREADAVTLPSDFVERLIAQLYVADKRRLLQEFRELGASVVGLLKIAAEDLPSLTELARDFEFLVPIKHFGLIDGGSGNIQVEVVGAGKTIETTECSSEFLKSVLIGYGYSITKEELHPGAIVLWGQKNGHALEGL